MKSNTLSTIGILFYLLLAGGSIQCPAGAAAVVNFARIAYQANRVSQYLNYAKQASQSTSTAVNQSYLGLSQRLATKQINGTSIGEMEANLLDMKSKADTLRFALKQTEQEAEILFDLLTTRAEQNKTDELKEILLDDIEKKEETFNAKLEIANNVLEELDNSIQKYDDILGFIQISVATEEIDKYTNQVNSVISQGSSLSSRIQSAINDGLKIVTAIEKQAEAGSKTEVKTQ